MQLQRGNIMRIHSTYKEKWDRMFKCPCPTKSEEECMAHQKRLFKVMMVCFVLAMAVFYIVGIWVGINYF
jgi:hypothetical protein